MAQPRFSTKLDEARKWLRSELEAGVVYKAGEVQQRALEAGIKRRTLQLAATYEAEVKPKHGDRGIEAWEWVLK